ncbi:MAG: anti-sigma factor [Verrucomicrobiota bacterium]
MSDFKHRYEELRAGQVLNDLDDAEFADLEQLCGELEDSSSYDPEIEMIAAALEGELSETYNETAVPDKLSQALMAQVETFTKGGESPVDSNTEGENGSEEERKDTVLMFMDAMRHPFAGWGAAAAILLLAFLLPSTKEVTTANYLAERSVLLEDTSSVVAEFRGLDGFEAARGSVVWNRGEQKGFMTLAGLPSNNPLEAQYQLWIVDPSRDTEPVDGGVFDIPKDGGEAVIPIEAKLRVDQPVLFLVTREKPGGVVVSDQVVKVVLAEV